MRQTRKLFSFELDLGAGEKRMDGEQLEDVFSNCLDFCILYDCSPHFFLVGENGMHHPEFWRILELIRDADATFSFLSEPEKSRYDTWISASEESGGQAGLPISRLPEGSNPQQFAAGYLTVAASNDEATTAREVKIHVNGNLYVKGKKIGNIFEDRLADIWVVAGLSKNKEGGV